MRKSILRSIQVWIVATLIFLGARQSAAVDGRDFAGFYELKNVVDQGAIMSLTFSTQVFNYSDGDVIGAYVALDDSLMLENYAAFLGVRIDHGSQVFLSSDITVPALEYQQWQRGARPNLYVIYQDHSGNTLIRLVELIEMPLGGQS
jgi:hypothetical protein